MDIWSFFCENLRKMSDISETEYIIYYPIHSFFRLLPALPVSTAASCAIVLHRSARSPSPESECAGHLWSQLLGVESAAQQPISFVFSSTARVGLIMWERFPVFSFSFSVFMRLLILDSKNILLKYNLQHILRLKRHVAEMFIEFGKLGKDK